MNNIIRRPFRYTFNNTVFWIIGINLFIFALTYFLFPRQQQLFVTRMSMIPFAVIELKWVWTFITYMFMHGSITHILFNMLGLFIFGLHVERQMGSKEFLLYYLLTGVLAGVFSFFIYYLTGQYIVALMGASGALFAVMLAYAIFFPNSIIYVWGILPLRAPVMVIGYTALELFFSIRGSRGNTAHLTHLAGFAFGWIYFMVRFGVNPFKRLFGR
ncbi:MAG: rhomboid family intramembrane serine protease [Treponema sp.]|nr:rhomboid family intramembrane serine protease [Treponema sp.]